jgi:flagellar motor switch protein FliM
VTLTSTPERPAQPEPQPFDFRRPSKFSRDQTRVLEIVGETFARQYTTVLSTAMRTVAPVTLSSIDQLTYDEYIRLVGNPSFLAVLSLDPLPGAGILHLNPSLSMLVVDRLLGGSGKAGHPGRALTDIEAGLLRELVGRILRELAYAFESLAPIQPKIVQVESNPQFAQVAAPSDLMLVISFEIRLGQRAEMTSLCLPLAALQGPLEAYIAQSMFAERATTDPAAVVRALSDRLLDAPVEVGVRFKPVTVTSGELVDLQVGDVLGLRHPVSEPLTVSAAGIPYLLALPGRRDKRLACQVVEPGPGRGQAG